MRRALVTRLVMPRLSCGLAGAVLVGAAFLSAIAGSLELSQSRGPQGPAKTSPAPARPRQSSLVETLKDASSLADGVTDPEESLNAHMALAWAQIKSGDHHGAQATLERAEKTASKLGTDARCIARVRIAHALGECGGKARGLALLAETRVEAEGLEAQDRPWPLKSIAVAQCDLGDREAAQSDHSGARPDAFERRRTAAGNLEIHIVHARRSAAFRR